MGGRNWRLRVICRRIYNVVAISLALGLCCYVFGFSTTAQICDNKVEPIYCKNLTISCCYNVTDVLQAGDLEPNVYLGHGKEILALGSNVLLVLPSIASVVFVTTKHLTQKQVRILSSTFYILAALCIVVIYVLEWWEFGSPHHVSYRRATGYYLLLPTAAVVFALAVIDTLLYCFGVVDTKIGEGKKSDAVAEAKIDTDAVAEAKIDTDAVAEAKIDTEAVNGGSETVNIDKDVVGKDNTDAMITDNEKSAV